MLTCPLRLQFVLSRYQFKCPFFLLATQLACLLAICTVVKVRGGSGGALDRCSLSRLAHHQHMPEHKQPFPLPTLKLETYKK